MVNIVNRTKKILLAIVYAGLLTQTMTAVADESSTSKASLEHFAQIGIVANKFEWPVTLDPEIEIRTKVDHVAALTSTSDIATNSQRWIRVHLRSTQPGPELEHVITIIHRANLHGMKVLVNVAQHAENFDNRSDYLVDLTETSITSRWQAVARFSGTSPEKFRARMERMLKAFSKENLRVDAFEICNELDWAPFNGDLVNDDGTAPTLSAMQQTISKYAEIFKIAHDLIQNDTSFKFAKLITFGFANPSHDYLTRPRSAGGLGLDPKALPIMPAEVFFGELQGVPYSFNGAVQQPINKENILTKFADGIGLHVYADDPEPVMRSFAALAQPSGKPLWITEWGYLKDKKHQQDDTRRNKMNDFIRKANEIKDPPVETLFYYSYDDKWGIVYPMTPTSDPSVPGAVYDSAFKVFKDYTH